jgi:protoheme IX farnesyltransferase
MRGTREDPAFRATRLVASECGLPLCADFGGRVAAIPVQDRLRNYWSLVKSLQTALLLAIGVAGFLSVHPSQGMWPTLSGLAGTLALAISGSTVLNMAYDADIDARMSRTCWRALPTGQVSVRQAVIFGGLLAGIGVAWALGMSPLYGAIIATGVLFDVVVYTVWLKRRTPYAIVIGGLAGGMPVLAGRALALGRVDALGIMLALGVLLWIPTHIMTFSMRHFEDYQAARVPTFPAAYGFRATRTIIAISSLAAAMLMAYAAAMIGASWGWIRLLVILGAGLLGLAVWGLVRPSERASFTLFKYASVYMFASMAIVVAAG